jgi:hypothetical protein
LSSGGGLKKLSSDGGERVINGLWSARKTRRVVGEPWLGWISSGSQFCFACSAASSRW